MTRHRPGSEVNDIGCPFGAGPAEGGQWLVRPQKRNAIMLDFILDFLTFRILVSPYVLLIFYYLGAVMMPLAMWIFWRWLKKRYVWLSQTQEELGDLGRQYLSPARRALIVFGCLLCFFMMELFWRMMFEFVMAYFHMVLDIQRLTHGGYKV